MDPKQIVGLTLQVSVMAIVFGFGLNATIADLMYVVRRPGLLLRSLLAMWVVVPAVAVALVRTLDLPPTVRVVLVALAISPVPPLLPMKQTKSGGNASFGLGLMAILGLLSIVAVPVLLDLNGRIFGLPLTIAPGAIAKMVAIAVLVPLAAGMAVRAILPAIALPMAKPVSKVATVLLALAALVLIVAALPAMRAALNAPTVLAMVILTAVGLAVGHWLGRPDPDDSTVLALSAACRHPAIALAIASANFPDERFGPIILLYMVVNALAVVPYLMWRKRRAAAGAPAA